MYQARAIKVMIASPSDVANERQIVRDVVREWNVVHSEDKGIVLMPVGWETHAQPGMGARPQALINKDVLAGCDLLVAVFWTRVGTPTGESVSGTVEEIQEHLKAGKPAMLYFSRVPVRLDSVEDTQYQALLEFRSECERQGLIDTYDSIEEFREKFARHLAQTIIRNFSVGVEEEANMFAVAQALRGQDPLIESLSEEARELLAQAAVDRNGTVMRLLTMSGLGIQTNGRQFTDRGNPRSEAIWDGALRQLRDLELLKDVGHKGEIFTLTAKGYEIADRIEGGIGATSATVRVDNSFLQDPTAVLILQAIHGIEQRNGRAGSATYREVVDAIESMTFGSVHAVTVVSELQSLRRAGVVWWPGDLGTVLDDMVIELSADRSKGYLKRKVDPKFLTFLK